MTPIERAARALARAQWDVKDLHGTTNESCETWVEKRWRDHVPNARAVIAAIRDHFEVQADALQGAAEAAESERAAIAVARTHDIIDVLDRMLEES